MSDLGWFAAFATIFVVMVALSGFMAWYSRRAMKDHKAQIEDMIREMRDLIHEEKGAESASKGEPES